MSRLKDFAEKNGRDNYKQRFVREIACSNSGNSFEIKKIARRPRFLSW